MAFVTNSPFPQRYRSHGQYLFKRLLRSPFLEPGSVAKKVSNLSVEVRKAFGESRKASVEVRSAIGELLNMSWEIRNARGEVRNTTCEIRNAKGEVHRRFGEACNALVGLRTVRRNDFERGKNDK